MTIFPVWASSGSLSLILLFLCILLTSPKASQMITPPWKSVPGSLLLSPFQGWELSVRWHGEMRGTALLALLLPRED